MRKMTCKLVMTAVAGAAMISAAPASAIQAWIYYGANGEVIGYKVARDDGSLCFQWGYESSSWSYTSEPGEPCP